VKKTVNLTNLLQNRRILPKTSKSGFRNSE
jgi:hypothetical protein